MKRTFSILLAVAITIGFPTLGLLIGWPIPAIVFSIASGGGLILWFATTNRVQIEPRTVAAFFVPASG